MNFSAFSFVLCCFNLFVVRCATETLTAQDLLGSSFGVPDLPTTPTFDYVIAGGGTGGLALARRLSQNNSVAVVEAGSFYEFSNGNLSTVPATAFYFLGSDPQNVNPLEDWLQYITPQAGLGGKTSLYASGRVFGGGSARNILFYQRGTVGSYQLWADLVGDVAYTFDNLMPYFKKSVNFTAPNTSLRASNATPSYDVNSFAAPGQGGPLQVSYPNWANPISSWAALSLQALGFEPRDSFVDGNLLGWSYAACSQSGEDQTRSSSETSFLREALLQSGDKITLYDNTLARRVLFDGTEAVGLEVTSGTLTTQKTYNITATKEVIVSAGTFRSPQLLLVSGIGPNDALNSLDIPVIKDLPGVGQNMKDHVLFGPNYQVDVTTHSNIGDPAFAAEAAMDFHQNRTGILTNGGADVLAFEKLPQDLLAPSTRSDLDNEYPSDWPDVEYLINDAYTGDQRDFLNGAPKNPNSYASQYAALVAPFSRGNVTIATGSTADNPIVNPNWLSDPRDQEVAIAAYKRARQIFNSTAMSPVVLEEAYPGVDVSTDEEILDTIRDSALTVWHAAGSNAMGTSDDPMAVVDSQARVFGVQRLRVVDASAFPVLPPGHPQATVYVLAEKIADDIINGV